jgi:hypothetical protein
MISEEAKGQIHGNRGRPLFKTFNSKITKKIVDLFLTTYTNFHETYFTKKLKEIEGITAGIDTVRRLRRVNGIQPKQEVLCSL